MTAVDVVGRAEGNESEVESEKGIQRPAAEKAGPAVSKKVLAMYAIASMGL